MAATYGYSGEFSSDEEIDRIEKQTERLVQSKFDSFSPAKPTKEQINQAIEAIKKSKNEHDYSISDELLGGILDTYKVSRGPIVDSTRNLYKKIALRMARGDQDGSGSTNGNANNNNNDKDFVEIIAKKAQQHLQVHDEIVSYSSDEDEPMPPVSELDIPDDRRKFDSRVIHDNGEPMDIDSEGIHNGQVRDNKQVDMATTDEDDSETQESSEENPEPEEEKEVVPVVKPTPRKPVAKTTSVKATPSEFKKVNSPGETDTVKKPYTRSQRNAAVKTSPSTGAKNLVTDSKGRVDTDVFVKSQSRSGLYIKIVVALAVVVLAFVLFKFKSDIIKSTDGILPRKINF